MRLRFGRWEMRVIWRKRPDPYCIRPGHKCATPGAGPCNGLPRLSDVYANPRLIGTERKADYPDGTCAYGRDCDLPWTPHDAMLCAPRSHDDCPPEGCPATMPADLRAALDDPCKAKFRAGHGCLVSCTEDHAFAHESHKGQCACDLGYIWPESQALYPGEDHVTPGDRCDGCA